MKGKFHQYSGDSSDRRLIHVYLTIIAILFSYLLYWLSKNTCLVIPWWFDAPAIFGFYGLIYFWFKKVLWRNKTARLLFNIKTPNWNGDYSCILKTSYDNFESEKPVSLKLIQDWDSIIVQIETENSISNSLSGSFSLDETVFSKFTYEYINKPKNHAPETMNIHYGMASIWMDSGKLNGEFFNGRGRNNYGIIEESE